VHPVVAAVRGSHVVVTGGAGFVGSWLCERLLGDGNTVTCVDNLSTGRRENCAHLLGHDGFRLVVADVCDPLDPLVAEPVDLVMHLASPASPLHYLRLPIETLRGGSLGTLNALELAEAHQARFLLASTSEVYGDPLVHPQPESYWGNVNPIGPRSVYDEAKRFAEAATAAYRRERGVDTTIARIFNTYGPRMRLDDGRAVPAFAKQTFTGQPLTVAGDGSQTRSLCYVEDTVAGLLALAASGHPGPVNIGNDVEISMLELARTVRDLLGSDCPIIFVDLPEDDPHLRRPDTSLAREVLGWSPQVPMLDGLTRTLEWFEAQVAPEPVGQPVS
jgi:dTDP-glucose 4,6-dehydratase